MVSVICYIAVSYFQYKMQQGNFYFALKIYVPVLDERKILLLTYSHIFFFNVCVCFQELLCMFKRDKIYKSELPILLH